MPTDPPSASTPVGTCVDIPVTEQATAAGRAIEAGSFAIIDAEAGPHAYTPAEWALVRRMIHASADFDLNGLTRFSPNAIDQALALLTSNPTAPPRSLLADVRMIPAGLAPARLARFRLQPRVLIDLPEVLAAARADGTTRATQAMRRAAALGLLDGAIVAIGNAPTALQELIRLIETDGHRPGLVLGMPVGFVGAAESKAALARVGTVPWVLVSGRKGGSTLIVAAVHALLALAAARDNAPAPAP
ncbi:MAG: precorrin-8X methylmutase [Chromatiaceae bacterium]|nr:MAG: precorrin-8X methylmutase [Chromatiaceae bacterium]